MYYFHVQKSNEITLKFRASHWTTTLAHKTMCYFNFKIFHLKFIFFVSNLAFFSKFYYTNFFPLNNDGYGVLWKKTEQLINFLLLFVLMDLSWSIWEKIQSPQYVVLTCRYKIRTTINSAVSCRTLIPLKTEKIFQILRDLNCSVVITFKHLPVLEDTIDWTIIFSDGFVI